MIADEFNVKSFKDHLLALMKERGETVTSIAKAIGVSKSSVSEWCAGRRPILDESIVKLARHLGVSTERLITGVEPEENLAEKFIEQMQDGFMTLHSGVYRLRVEKFVGTPPRATASGQPPSAKRGRAK